MNRQAVVMKKIRENFGSFEDIWLFSQIFFLSYDITCDVKAFLSPQIYEIIYNTGFEGL